MTDATRHVWRGARQRSEPEGHARQREGDVSTRGRHRTKEMPKLIT
jgi:hypothetical protein